MVLGRTQPSYISFWISIIAYISLIPIVLKQHTRVYFGMMFSIINVALLTLVVLAKVKYAPREDLLTEWTNNVKTVHKQAKEDNQKPKIKDFLSYAYVINKDESTGAYICDLKASLRFEVSSLIIFTISLIFFVVMHFKI
jgi:hypothetical protein